MHAHIINHRCVNVCICMLNFRSWSQLRNLQRNFSDIWYFRMGSYKCNVVAIINMGAYYREFTVIHKIKV